MLFIRVMLFELFEGGTTDDTMTCKFSWLISRSLPTAVLLLRALELDEELEDMDYIKHTCAYIKNIFEMNKDRPRFISIHCTK